LFLTSCFGAIKVAETLTGKRLTYVEVKRLTYVEVAAIAKEDILQRERAFNKSSVLWNAWKERNRRIFTGKRLTYVEVAAIAKEDILQRERAFNTYVPAIPAEPD
jgi:BarA-like signal transduction histidine kinase